MPFQAAAARAAESALVATEASCFEELASPTGRRYIMVSGKGGVGKTSLSASLAVKLAGAGLTTLVVSTDPAHSLGDSLAQDLSGGKPVLLEGTDLPLWGMEIDPSEAQEEFMSSSASSNTAGQVQEMLKGMGMGMIAEQLADLKLSELLNTPPPGLDEAVAISKVVQFVQSQEYARFDRIVFDTAPTGHTLRLLALPDFVDASLAKIIRLRKKLSSATGAVRGLFGAGESQDELVQKLEVLRTRIQVVQALFRDKAATEFIIATIPTVLGVNESARLLGSLRKEGIPCKRIVVNQVIGPTMGATYLKMKLKDQQASLHMVDTDPDLVGLRKVIAPLVDLEVRGVPALTYFGDVVWKDVYENMNAGPDKKYFLLGGKGGVGKTSCASALATKFASDGIPTLVVSTDPAHSLSDSFDQDLTGGSPVRIVSPLGGDMPLWGMQIDPESARTELRDIMADDGGAKLNQVLDGLGLGVVSEQLKDLQLGSLLDTPPPGVDEAIAISKVVQFLKSPEYSHFRRIVFDTAPTGHTLRLLTLPDFVDASLGKIIRLRQKISAVPNAIKGFFGGKSEEDPAVLKLEELKTSMEEARDLFRNEQTTEFVIVTIPTIMATTESCRLAAALRKESVPIRTIVVNQVVQAGATEKFLASRRADQQRALAGLRSDPGLAELQLITGPLCDLEVRGVPALTYFGNVVWK
ncbi:MAG: hypothetical protein WDW36_008988 [Sanguina aurantia]